MGSSGLIPAGRSNSFKDTQNQFVCYNYCGGGGAVFTPPELGVEGVVLEYRVSKNIVDNRKIIFENIGVYITSNSAGGYAPQDCYIGLSDVSTDDLETTAKASGIVLNDALGDYVEFGKDLCPQPYLRPWEGTGPNTNWNAKVYVYLWWGDVTFCNYYIAFKDAITNGAFRIIKHDNDIRV